MSPRQQSNFFFQSIGNFYPTAIPINDTFEASWGGDQLSLTTNLNDCSSKKDFEIDKVRRNLEWMKAGSSMDKEELLKARANFYKFFTQHDERRDTDFLSTFPEMEDWWNICKEAEALV